MAMPLEFPKTPTHAANTVLDAKEVKLVLVKYTDEFSRVHMVPAVVGDKTVHLLDARLLGFSNEKNDQGPAQKWMTDGVFKALKKGK